MSNDNLSDNYETIEVLEQSQIRTGRWNPIVGNETIELLQSLPIPIETGLRVRDEALSILSRCVPPSEPSGQETGLVVGYIQSGKTMSFTTVTALACDNNYAMIIVIAGTSIPLTEQSKERLRHDLRIERRQERRWRHFHNPQITNNDHIRISDVFDEWRDNTVPPEERRTVLITVMKHHGRLNNLIEVLQQINLDRLPVLIIDDEADQAGLNNLIRVDDESTTYARLRQLKDIIPHHTFLEYTATPQGPLLINIIDVLSPEFAVVLTPGVDYVGGQDYFIENDELIIEIPSHDIFSRSNEPKEPPDSLLDALRVFFLGVASGIVRGQNGNRSMMIHPSQSTLSHETYYRWIQAIRNNWKNILQIQNPNDPDYQDLISDFENAYEQLQRTVTDLESFDILCGRLHHAIGRTELHLVNARRGKTPQVNWAGTYPHILVGGQALDRGYTVEGLTVTYMPRGVGTRQADTIQQRARFFGYKRSYMNFCRIFIESEVSDIFRSYIQHEENTRRLLSDHLSTNRPLSELRRAFLLTRRLYPTRPTIINNDFVRVNFNEGWFFPRSPHESIKYVANNIQVIGNFTRELAFVSDSGHPERTKIQRHEIATDIPLSKVYELLLINLQFARLDDAQNLLGVLVIIDQYLAERGNATCDLYKMSSGLSRVRRLNQNGEIPNLFQGAAPVNPPELRGTIYPGDRHIRSDSNITLQIHMLDIPNNGWSTELRQQIPSIPCIAIWIPGEIVGDVYIQDQGQSPEIENE